MEMAKKRILTGLVLLTLLIMVGADLGLVRSNTYQVVSLGHRADGVASVALPVRSSVRAAAAVAGVVGRWGVKAGVAEPSRASHVC